MSSLKRRGQAFVTMDSESAAEKAAAALQGASVGDKTIKIDFAKKASDAVTKRDGTFAPREKAPKPAKVKAAPEAAAKRRAVDRAFGFVFLLGGFLFFFFFSPHLFIHSLAI